MAQIELPYLDTFILFSFLYVPHMYYVVHGTFRVGKQEVAQIGKWNKDKLDFSYVTDAPQKNFDIVRSGKRKKKLPSSCWYVLPRSRVIMLGMLKKAILRCTLAMGEG